MYNPHANHSQSHHHIPMFCHGPFRILLRCASYALASLTHWAYIANTQSLTFRVSCCNANAHTLQFLSQSSNFLLFWLRLGTKITWILRWKLNIQDPLNPSHHSSLHCLALSSSSGEDTCLSNLKQCAQIYIDSTLNRCASMLDANSVLCL